MRQRPDFHVVIVGDEKRPPFDPDMPGDGFAGGGKGGGGFPWPFSSSPKAPVENRPDPETQDSQKKGFGGMTGAEIAFLVSQIAGPALQAAFSDDPQERRSFEGKGDADPSYLMHKNQMMLDSIMPLIMGRANAGVSLPSAVVQQPGSYSGGGMAMPIGLVASDPALSNPNLLKLPGLSGVDGATTPIVVPPPYQGGDDDATPDSPDYVDQDGYHDVDPPSGAPPRTAQPRSGPMRRSAMEADPLFDEGALINPGDDLQQALGSVQLLLDAYR